MKRKLIPWGVFAALVLSFMGLTLALSDNRMPGYGLANGSIGFTGNDASDITKEVLGGAGYTAAVNDSYALELSGTADVRIRHKATGRVWNAVPEDAAGADSKYASSLILRYHSGNNKETALYSAENSVEKEQVRVYAIENGARVEYIFGDMDFEYIYPEQISKDRMEMFCAALESEEDAEYLQRRYTLYELEQFDGANRELLLKQYPRLEKEDLYVLTSISTKTMKKRTDELFRRAGYTEEDRRLDNGGEASAAENSPVFRVAVNYTLTETGFTAWVDVADCAFYKEYPLTNLELLPYFDCFGSGETGYMLLPSGSGGLLDIGETPPAKETTISLPVYGQDSVLTQNLGKDVCSLPVFGQYKSGGGYLCILDDGSEQATILGEKAAQYAAAHASFMILDTASFQLAARNDTFLFAQDMTAKRLSLEYVLLPDVQEEEAYSDMAAIYRTRLEAEGVLTKKTDSGVKLLAEMVGAINYDTLAAGFIPANKEYAMTTFAQAQVMAEELAAKTGAGNLRILLTGWNKKGLNRQKPGCWNFSAAAGGKKGYETMSGALAQQGSLLYTELALNSIRPFPMDGYSPSSHSARTLNNTIVSLSELDVQTGAYVQNGRQLISPARFDSVWKQYQKERPALTGVGVAQLTSLLYGDYANDTVLSRGQARATVEKVLKTASDRTPVLGDVGNLYTLRYLSFINNLPVTSGGLSTIDRDVPFVQMVLHGHIEYAAPCMNGAADPQRDLLKAVETGSSLHYVLTANTFDKLFNTDSAALYTTRYETVRSQLEEQYDSLRAALGGLGDKAMTGHRYLTDTVVMTSYEGGTHLLVNYGRHAYTHDGVRVEPLTYARLDAEASST